MPMTAHQRHCQFRQYTTRYIAVAGTSIVINIQRSSCHCCCLYKTSIIYRSISEQLLLCRLLIAFWRLLNKGEFPYVQLISYVDLVSQMDLSFNFHVSLYAQKTPPKKKWLAIPTNIMRLNCILIYVAYTMLFQISHNSICTGWVKGIMSGILVIPSQSHYEGLWGGLRLQPIKWIIYPLCYHFGVYSCCTGGHSAFDGNHRNVDAGTAHIWLEEVRCVQSLSCWHIFLRLFPII